MISSMGSKRQHSASQPSHVMPHARAARVLAHVMMEVHSSWACLVVANVEGSGYTCRVRQCAACSLHSGQTEASAGVGAWWALLLMMQVPSLLR